MPGSYAAFFVWKETTAGEIESVGSGVTVHVRQEGAGSDVAESPLTTASGGFIAAGSIAALSPGDVVYFRVENLGGLSASVAQTLT